MAEDFAALGVSVDPDAIEESQEDVFEVFAANWPALLAFLACLTQWRFAGAFEPERTGLDYAAVDAVLRRQGAGDHVLEEVREIELGALEGFAEVRRREG